MKTKSERTYVVISPVKDEGRHIANTIESVLSQSILPVKWVIVDDGSSDDTVTIVRDRCGNLGWVTLIALERERERMPGSAVINAFNAGYEAVKGLEFEYLVKLDGDLKFERRYFERLIQKFEENDSLGIASGVYHEICESGWARITMPRYHAAGASKVVRRACFAQIGGFEPSRGWDTVDEIKAMVRGWETRHFEDIGFYHLKREGTGIGTLRTGAMHGEIYYLTGGGKLFFVLKFIHRLLYGEPFLAGGVSMLYGYSKAALIGRHRLVTKEEMALYRRMLNRRIRDDLRSYGKAAFGVN